MSNKKDWFDNHVEVVIVGMEDKKKDKKKAKKIKKIIKDRLKREIL